MSNVMCHVSRVMYHLSPVTCHLSLTPTAPATYRPPANSPMMHSRLVCKEARPRKLLNAKNHQENKNPKMSRGMPIFALRSWIRSLQSTRKRVFRDGTAHRHTTHGHHNLETESAQRAKSVKKGKLSMKLLYYERSKRADMLLNNPAAQAAGSDPSQCNSSDRQTSTKRV